MAMDGQDGAGGRPLLAHIIKGMTVVDSDGTRIGTVDKVEGGHLKISRVDQKPRNQHQYVTPDWIAAVDDRVTLNRTYDEAKRLWASEPYAERHHLERAILIRHRNRHCAEFCWHTRALRSSRRLTVQAEPDRARFASAAQRSGSDPGRSF